MIGQQLRRDKSTPATWERSATLFSRNSANLDPARKHQAGLAFLGGWSSSIVVVATVRHQLPGERRSTIRGRRLGRRGPDPTPAVGGIMRSPQTSAAGPATPGRHG